MRGFFHAVDFVDPLPHRGTNDPGCVQRHMGPHVREKGKGHRLGDLADVNAKTETTPF